MRILLWHGYRLGRDGVEHLHAPAGSRVAAGDLSMRAAVALWRECDALGRRCPATSRSHSPALVHAGKIMSEAIRTACSVCCTTLSQM